MQGFINVEAGSSNMLLRLIARQSIQIQHNSDDTLETIKE